MDGRAPDLWKDKLQRLQEPAVVQLRTTGCFYRGATSEQVSNSWGTTSHESKHVSVTHHDHVLHLRISSTLS